MLRIEKTEVNCGAFITLSATLTEAQTDSVFEIGDNYSSFTIRPKREDEKKDLTINLEFLNQLFHQLVTSYKPILATGEAEKYIRNCSFACHYFRKENERLAEFDLFDIFHEVHFQKVNLEENENILLNQFCRLFRISPLKFSSFIGNQEINSVMQLPQKEAFNEVFKTITIERNDSAQQIIFESHDLDMRDSLNTLFTIKDLLFARGFDTKLIPEHSDFSIGQNEQVDYSFNSMNNQFYIVSFKYDKIKFIVQKSSS